MTITGMAAPFFPLPAQPPMEIEVQYCDNNLVPLGEIQWATIDATLNYNSVGSWSILAPYNKGLWDAMMAGDFIVLVNWRGLFTFGGKCETPTYQSQIPGATSGATAGSFNGGEFITLAGADFLQPIANRLAYPDPTKVWNQQLQGNGDIVGGTPLETAIKWYVNRNIGTTTIPIIGGKPAANIPPAIPSRQHPLLVVGPDRSSGPVVNYQVNFGVSSLNLLDVVRALIGQAYPNYTPGQGMVLNCGLNPNNPRQLLFEVSAPVNKTNVLFSEEMGNLTSILFSLTDPTCTNACVRGTAVNQFIEVPGNNVTPWNKIEVFQDGNSDDTNKNLTTLANNMLVDGTFGPVLTATVTDTPYCVYGRDYSLGDLVTIEVRPGVTYNDIISSVTLTADPSATPILSVLPIVGNSTNPTASSQTVNKQLVNQIKYLEKRLAQMGK